MYDKSSNLTLFASLNKKLKIAREPAGNFSSSISKLRALIIVISKNIELIPQEHEIMFNKLKTKVGSENSAKMLFFTEKLDQAFSLAAIGDFLDTNEMLDLKQVLISLYIDALEEQTDGNVVHLLKQKIQNTVNDIRSTTDHLPGIV